MGKEKGIVVAIALRCKRNDVVVVLAVLDVLKYVSLFGLIGDAK